MKTLSPVVFFGCFVSFGLVAEAGKPVPVPIPNGDVSDPTLKGFRFRYDSPPNQQEQYVGNHKWVKSGVVQGRKCVMIQAPASVLAIQTAKVESALVPVEPGATYRYDVDYCVDKTQTKMWAETFVVDPRPDRVREEEESKGKKVSIMRFSPENGMPAIIMVHRAQAPDLPGVASWGTATKEFTIPKEWPLTLPFTIRGDGQSTVFPVQSDRKDADATFEVIEVRLRTADQKLPFRQNKGQDYQVEKGAVVFVKPPPPGSEATVNVKWKLKPHYMSIKAIALAGSDGSTAAFTNFRLTKTKEPGEAEAPVDGIVR